MKSQRKIVELWSSDPVLTSNNYERLFEASLSFTPACCGPPRGEAAETKTKKKQVKLASRSP
jgi:hypothetical protein